MIAPTAQTCILLALQPVDFRLGIDGLVALTRKQLNRDPFDGSVLIFVNRRRTHVRALVYDQNGFWLMTKRLSRGHFSAWPSTDQPLSSLMARQLRQFLAAQSWQVCQAA